jgi:transcriptional regulator with XRE-family HTH domain
MKLNIAIGMTIRNMRHEQNMTLRRFSSKSFVALGYLSEIERGKKDASSHVLEGIANGLGLTTTEFLTEVCQTIEKG